jgi:3D (Asp-Asp-Asp) domain-containing protein
MKRSIGAIGLALLLAPTAVARSRTVTPAQREQTLLARVTVYWASGGRGSDWYTRRHKGATGVRLHAGHCAVDPRRIPYGSKVVFPDGVFTAVDTGTAVINRKAARRSGRTPAQRNAIVVDRFFETKRQALAWAKAHPEFMTVQVFPSNYSGSAIAEQSKSQERQAVAAAIQQAKRGQAVAATIQQTKRIANNEYLSAPFGRMRRH